MVFRKIVTIKSFKTSQKEKGANTVLMTVSGRRAASQWQKQENSTAEKAILCFSETRSLWMTRNNYSVIQVFFKADLSNSGEPLCFSVQERWTTKRLATVFTRQVTAPQTSACLLSTTSANARRWKLHRYEMWEHIFKIFRYYKKETVFCIWLTAAGKDLQDAV